jgi:hypothetical protein
MRQELSLSADDGPFGRQHEAALSREFQRVGELRIAESRKIGVLERGLRDDQREASTAPGLNQKDLRSLVEREEIAMITVTEFPSQELTDQLQLAFSEGRRYLLRFVGHCPCTECTTRARAGACCFAGLQTPTQMTVTVLRCRIFVVHGRPAAEVGGVIGYGLNFPEIVPPPLLAICRRISTSAYCACDSADLVG